MGPLELNEEAIDAHSRTALIVTLRCNLAMMENWRRLQQDAWGRVFDYETTLILIAIVVIGADRLNFEGPDAEMSSLTAPMEVERLRKCNISSIAATTELNRETVRRRIEALRRDGFVVRQPDGGVQIAPGHMQRPEMRAAVFAQVRTIARHTNSLLSTNLLVVART